MPLLLVFDVVVVQFEASSSLLRFIVVEGLKNKRRGRISCCLCLLLLFQSNISELLRLFVVVGHYHAHLL